MRYAIVYLDGETERTVHVDGDSREDAAATFTAKTGCEVLRAVALSGKPDTAMTECASSGVATALDCVGCRFLACWQKRRMEKIERGEK